MISRSSTQHLNVQFAATLIITLALVTAVATPTRAGLMDSQIAFAAAEKIEAFTDATSEEMENIIRDSPTLRRLERNIPWIELRNESPSGGGNLTEFHLTIGDERFNFSNVVFGNFTSTSPLSDVTDFESTVTADGDELVLKFDNTPLGPGQRVLFRIDIDVDPDQSEILETWAYPDFRTVLFDMNGIDAYGPNPKLSQPPDDSDNAVGYGILRLIEETVETVRRPFPDAFVEGPQSNIFNQFLRPDQIIEQVDTFRVEALSVAAISTPEPTSALLALFGLAGLVLRRRSFGSLRCNTRSDFQS